MFNITPTQLRRAADLQEKIQELQAELNQVLDGEVPTPAQATEARKKKYKFSAASRARMRAAQKARWAKVKAGKAQEPKKKFTAAGRARLAALARARWAEAKKAGKSRL